MIARALCLLAAVSLAAACKSDDGPPPGVRAGRALAGDLTHAVAASTGLSAPFPCARLEGAGPPAIPFDRVEGRVARLKDRALSLQGEDRTAVVGVIADARGARRRTLAQLRRIRARFAEAKAEVVLSLGGLGREGASLAAALGVLADGPWVLVAMPGDREPVPAHRRAIDEVAGAGHTVVDGSQVRFIRLDGTVIATFPGVGSASRLIPGAEGCLHDEADARALAGALAGESGVRVWAGYAPPRQRGPGGSDLARGGVHIGERVLTEPIADSGAHVVLSGLVDEAALGAPGGDRRLGEGEQLFLAAGAAEAIPVEADDGSRAGGAALLLRLSAPRGSARPRVGWQRILLEVTEPGGAGH